MNDQSASQLTPVLHIEGLTKDFPGVKALDDVGFSVNAGEVHALIGENGAGKSTLLKILSGVYHSASGKILVNGAKADLSSPKAARRAGIAMIHQELQQVPELDVAQNMFLGAPITSAFLFTNKSLMRKRATEALALLDPTIDVSAKIKTLRVAQRQIIEIAKALLADARVIAMDEPTSSLTPKEFEGLAQIIKTLQAKNVAVIYVSHKLDEIFRVASKATILRDGKKVGSVDLSNSNQAQLVSMMVGRAIEKRTQKSHAQPKTVLEVKNLSRGTAVKDVSFNLHMGEVLGIAGLVGAGRTELVRLIAGIDKPNSGEIIRNGNILKFANPAQAISQGIALLPEERKKEGIIPLRSTMSNVAMPSFRVLSRFGIIKAAEIRSTVDGLTRQMNLRPPDIDRPIRLFSGGNQQKAIISRWLMARVEILIFDEPTRGIDVGAKAEIYRLIEDLAKSGHAIIIVSSELPEILQLADRVLVMRTGKVEVVLNGVDLTENTIMQFAVSGSKSEDQHQTLQ